MHFPRPLALAASHCARTRPPQAAHLDPRDAYCSRNPPPPHHPHHAMRPRSPRERLTPLGLAPPAYSRSQVQPLPSRRSRDASAAAHSPPLSRATALPLFWQESDPLSLARQSPPGSSPSAEDARERAGGLVSTLTPRRAARRRGSPLSGSLSLPIQHALEQHHFCAQPHTHPMSMYHVHAPIYPQSSAQCFLTLIHMVVIP